MGKSDFDAVRLEDKNEDDSDESEDSMDDNESTVSRPDEGDDAEYTVGKWFWASDSEMCDGTASKRLT